MKNHSSRKFVLAALAALALVASALQAQAQNVLVTFDLTQLQNNVPSSTITGSDGVTTLNVSTIHNWGGNTGAINVDDTNGLLTLDAADNVLIFKFSKAATLERYSIGLIDYDTAGILVLLETGNTAVNSSITYDGSQNAGSIDFADKLAFGENSSMTMTNYKPFGGNTQVHWSSLTVTVAVPEPASYALLLGFGAFLFIMIRHRIRR